MAWGSWWLWTGYDIRVLLLASHLHGLSFLFIFAMCELAVGSKRRGTQVFLFISFPRCAAEREGQVVDLERSQQSSIKYGPKFNYICFSSVQFSHSVVSDSSWPHESQHARPSWQSPTPGVHPDSRPSSQWCHPTVSSSVIPFSSCPQSLPASESFPMSQLFAWGGQSTGVSALASFLPKKSHVIK